MDLRDYEALKFRLAEVLRGVETALWRRGERPDALRPLYRRLAEDRFNVVVVGRFSRGKTSLMNAMLGRDWLPTAAVPLTSVITAVKYGSEPKAVLYYHHTSLFMDVKLWELPQHITERGNPGNRRGVSVAEVELPAEILRHGIYFVDTPGLGSSIAENTRNTERFLPEADALILVTSFDSPLSEEEVAIAALANASGRKLFVVLNKQDAVAASERAEVEAHVAARLDQVFAGAAPPAFPLSAADGLAARSCGDAAALAASGVPAFEAALGTFLANERRRNFVLAMCERLAALLQQQDLPAHLATLRSVRASVTADRSDKTTSSVALPALLADCEICAAAATAAFDALAKLQLDVSGEPASREALAREGGLCRWHLQQF
ncbi:MAG TPA: dynamin family protein, partial [Acetobacteraceae bacterium]|nr:dynamin family protein [Acetobacteraceae bacterium]